MATPILGAWKELARVDPAVAVLVDCVGLPIYNGTVHHGSKCTKGPKYRNMDYRGLRRQMNSNMAFTRYLVVEYLGTWGEAVWDRRWAQGAMHPYFVLLWLHGMPDRLAADMNVLARNRAACLKLRTVDLLKRCRDGIQKAKSLSKSCLNRSPPAHAILFFGNSPGLTYAGFLWPLHLRFRAWVLA